MIQKTPVQAQTRQIKSFLTKKARTTPADVKNLETSSHVPVESVKLTATPGPKVSNRSFLGKPKKTETPQQARENVSSAPKTLAVLEQSGSNTGPVTKSESTSPWLPHGTGINQTLGPLGGIWAAPEIQSVEAPAKPASKPAHQTDVTQPTVREMDEKLYAVHATRILPKNGTLRAGVGDWQEKGFEPPSFRPTVHFALGEMVQSHGRYEADQPYAVVTPVKSLKPQLANVAPHDTFIVGDLKIPKEATLVVPAGTDLKGIPKDLKVVTYPEGETLRKTVDKVIEDDGGWKISMESGGIKNGDTAKIEGQEINNSTFFRSLLDDVPGLSFGSHVYSQEGDADRMGTIEQCVNLTLNDTRQGAIEPAAHKLYNAVWDHQERKLEQNLPSHLKTNPQAQKSLQEKKKNIAGWRAIASFNEKLMSKGKRLVLTDQQYEALGSIKNQPALLQASLRDANTTRVDSSKPLEISTAVEALTNMGPKEYQEFKSGNPSVFKGVNAQKLDATYAVSRWALIGTERAKEENLNGMLAETLKPESGWAKIKASLFGQPKGAGFDPVGALSDSLSRKSGQLDTALEILRDPSLQEVQGKSGIRYEPGGPRTLVDVLKAHPRTQAVFHTDQESTGRPKQSAERLLEALGDKPRKSGDFTRSFSAATYELLDRRRDKEAKARDIQEATVPISHLKPTSPGERMNLAELKKRDFPNQEKLWDSVGLGPEFRENFPTGEAMWKSDWSLVQIFEKLEGAKRGKAS